MNRRNQKSGFRVRCIAAIITWVVMVLAAIPAYAQEENTISFQQGSVECGENTDVLLPLIGSGENIYGYEIRVEYPRELLTFCDIQSANAQGWDAFDENEGVISYAYTQVGETVGPLANHSVWAKLHFMTKGQGQAVVKITSRKLIDCNYQLYEDNDTCVTCTLAVSAAAPGGNPGGESGSSSGENGTIREGENGGCSGADAGSQTQVSQSGTTGKSTGYSIPSTADTQNVLLWECLAAISGTILIAIWLFRKYKHGRKSQQNLR